MEILLRFDASLSQLQLDASLRLQAVRLRHYRYVVIRGKKRYGGLSSKNQHRVHRRVVHGSMKAAKCAGHLRHELYPCRSPADAIRISEHPEIIQQVGYAVRRLPTVDRHAIVSRVVNRAVSGASRRCWTRGRKLGPGRSSTHS